MTASARCPRCGREQPDDDVSFQCRFCGADLAEGAVREEPVRRPSKRPLAVTIVAAGAALGFVLMIRTCTDQAVGPADFEKANVYLDGGAVPPPTPVNRLPPVTLAELGPKPVAGIAPPPGAGVVRGRVTWQRKVPPPTLPFLSEDRACGVTIFLPQVPVGELGGVTEAVVVAIPEGAPAPPAAPRAEPLVASLRACLPEPRLVAGPPGTKVIIRTVGTATHALQASSPLPGLPATTSQGVRIETELPAEGMVAITDPAHPWERFTLVALPSALSTTVNPEGFFRIAGVPPGKVTLRFFTEATGPFERTVTLAEGGEAMVLVDVADELPGFGKPAP